MGMNLIKAGYPLTVWNRTASRADELIAAGARLAKSPQEVAVASDFLLTMVSDPPALEEVLWGSNGAMQGLRRGSIYMDSSTVSPALARKIAVACTERGVRFLDAPVTGGDWGAKKGELVFMIGGDAETFREAEPILNVMGKKLFHLGPNGAGQTIKLAMNLILALQVDALAEALALVTRAGIQGEKLVEVMQSSMARSGVLRESAESSQRGIRPEFSPAPHAQGSRPRPGPRQSTRRCPSRHRRRARNLQLRQRRRQRGPRLFRRHEILEKMTLAAADFFRAFQD